MKEPEWYRKEWENINESGSEETDSESGEWESDREEDFIGDERMMQH